MKIWDIHPGYLGKSLLLNEHRELHSVENIAGENGAHVEHHDPAIAAWLFRQPAIACRHQWLVEEMSLRQLEHHSPMTKRIAPADWPSIQPTAAIEQFNALTKQKDQPRLPIPNDVETLWAQHAYSVMARDVSLYRELSARLKEPVYTLSMGELAHILTETLHRPCRRSYWSKVVLAMWEHCAPLPEAYSYQSSLTRPERLIRAIQFLAQKHQVAELWHSTALSDLASAQLVD